MKKLPLLILLITYQFLQAQKEKSPQMGLVTLEEVKLTTYEEDPFINKTTGDNQPQYAPISRTGDEGGDFIIIKRI